MNDLGAAVRLTFMGNTSVPPPDWQLVPPHVNIDNVDQGDSKPHAR